MVRPSTWRVSITPVAGSAKSTSGDTPAAAAARAFTASTSRSI